MNPFYEALNFDYIQKQTQQRYHNGQIQQVAEAAYKLQEFLNCVDNVDAAYQDALAATCCSVLVDYAKRHNAF